MPAPLQSTQGNWCSVLFPHRTQLQMLVHATVLYGRIYVTAALLPAGEPGKCSCGVLQLLQHRRHATWRVCSVRHVSQAEAGPHLHCCHLRKCWHHVTHGPELESGNLPGLGCILTVCPPQNISHLRLSPFFCHLGMWRPVPKASPNGYEGQGERVGGKGPVHRPMHLGKLLLVSKRLYGREGGMTSPRSGQGQAIPCGALELETVNSPLGLRGVGGSGGSGDRSRREG